MRLWRKNTKQSGESVSGQNRARIPSLYLNQETGMYELRSRWAAILGVSVLLAGCGNTNSPTASVSTATTEGSLAINPPLRIASVSAATLTAQLNASTSGQQLLQIAGAPTCGVDFYDIHFWTVGGAGEPTQSSGAVMVPTGAGCTGARSIVEYAHGTDTNKARNLADVTDATNTEGVLIAAMFAAQGYIVVAPNYAGYDISTLGYHPYINAQQNAAEMMDALTAARAALPLSGASDAGKLFLTGYSEGGYVAMAALRAMGSQVTAAAPASGPYAMEAFGDTLMTGHVDLGATVFAPLLTTSYQKAYGNIYTQPSDFYTSTYASGIDTLLPSTTPISTIIGTGLLPETTAFNSTTPTVTAAQVGGSAQVAGEINYLLSIPTSANPILAGVWGLGFGGSTCGSDGTAPCYLINDSVRVNYVLDLAGNPDGEDSTTAPTPALAAVAPTYPLRAAFYKNDLRQGNWVPAAPTLMCGGENDPTVYFPTNTGTMAQYWAPEVAASPALVTVLDVDPSTPPNPQSPFYPIQAGFQGAAQQQLAYLQSAAGGGLTLLQAEQTLIQNYHSDVAPFCLAAARAFFGNF